MIRLAERLRRTRDRFTAPLRNLFAGRRRIDPQDVEEVEALLLGADVGVEVTERIVEALRDGRAGDDALAYLRREFVALLGGETGGGAGPARSGRGADAPGAGSDGGASGAPGAGAGATRPTPGRASGEGAPGPRAILLVGVNGVGKTTTIARLARRLRSEGRSVILAACDTFRAAAADQLDAWARRLDVPMVRHADGGDPAAVAFDACRAARARGIDVVVVDTAGRLHTRVNLMEELAKIHRVCARELGGDAVETLLVLDATLGQNSLVQAEAFTARIPVDGIVLTKLDGTARGGIVLAVRQRLGIPVRWVGVGEGPDDLEPFDPETFVDALLGPDPGEKSSGSEVPTT